MSEAAVTLLRRVLEPPHSAHIGTGGNFDLIRFDEYEHSDYKMDRKAELSHANQGSHVQKSKFQMALP